MLRFRVAERPGKPAVQDGEPIIVVQDGKVIERNLARERLTIEDVEVGGPCEGDRAPGERHVGGVGKRRVG